ncbi:MAG TPA: hypothetical protein P5572_13845 [Phycisphaerae bacterium]|nr:hypothetical protein [Phycisphaerales bacterium]HRX86098.1 hypothetical protein [Phycisphaerae bacterium]
MIKRSSISTGHRLFLLIFALIFFVPAGIGFADKLYAFFFVSGLKPDGRFADGRFALIPLMNYLLVFGGMFCLLIWAIANGMFKDVEAPKYTMLENERELDAAEGFAWDDDAREIHP